MGPSIPDARPDPHPSSSFSRPFWLPGHPPSFSARSRRRSGQGTAATVRNLPRFSLPASRLLHGYPAALASAPGLLPPPHLPLTAAPSLTHSISMPARTLSTHSYDRHPLRFAGIDSPRPGVSILAFGGFSPFLLTNIIPALTYVSKLDDYTMRKPIVRVPGPPASDRHPTARIDCFSFLLLFVFFPTKVVELVPGAAEAILRTFRLFLRQRAALLVL